jgi:hypothetical protein
LCALCLRGSKKDEHTAASTRVRRNDVEESDAVGYIIFFITFLQGIASFLAMTDVDAAFFILHFAFCISFDF